MTTESGGASAPADVSNAAPIEQVDAAPAPINSDVPAAPVVEEPEAKPVPSTRDALKAAAAKVEAEQKVAGKEASAKPADGKPEPVRGEGGKFAPKDGEKPSDPNAKPAAIDPAATKLGTEKPAAVATTPPAVDPNAKPSSAPARFSADAKAVWDTAPEPVKAEVARMERELTAGIEKHRVSAEAYERVRPFDNMAKEAGVTLEGALKRYTDFDKLLSVNPLKGFEAIADSIGVSLKDVARIVLGEEPDQQASQTDATVRELRQEIATLKEQVGGVTSHFQQQHTSSITRQIEDWAASRPHFELIAPHIAAEMREGAATLDEAEQRVLQKYPQLAALSKPAAAKADPDPVIPAAASSVAAPDLEAQTLKGKKSINGAPSSGSEPAAQPRSSSIKEALRRAAAKAG